MMFETPIITTDTTIVMSACETILVLVKAIGVASLKRRQHVPMAAA